MIARKIIYKGNFNETGLDDVYDVTRRVSITGEIKKISNQEIELDLEGDPSMIKLIQHQIERKLKTSITGKEISHLPYKNFHGLTVLR